MKTAKNPNHPQPGDQIKVEPIRHVEDIKAIKEILQDKPRDFALFTLGINTNLRASDLRRITAGQVRHLKVGDDLELREKKTGKLRRVTLNRSCVDAVQQLLSSRVYQDRAPLFISRRGEEPLTVSSMNRLVKRWCAAVNLRGNYGTHTLRKTWGYHQRVTFGVGLPELMVCFNHSSQRQTLEYLCVQPEEIRRIYQNEL